MSSPVIALEDVALTLTGNAGPVKILSAVNLRIAAGETVVASATFLVDAESNLGSAIGGMANMPGMDVQEETQGPAPTTGTGATPKKSRSPATAKE